MATEFATEEFLKAAGRFSGERTNKETDTKYFVETGTKRHINHRIGIPVVTISPKGRKTRKLVGCFNTFAGAYAWGIANAPQPQWEAIRDAICDYYGQPKTLRPGPTTEMLMEDSTCDAHLEFDGEVPGVIVAGAGKPASKRKGTGVKKSAGKKKAKKKIPALKGGRGFSVIRATKNPEKAVQALESAMDVLKARERLGRRGTQLVELEQDGLTFIYQASLNEKATEKLKANPWAGDNAIQGEFMVMSSKKFKLPFSAAQPMEIEATE
jgi:hypothetical protein